MKAAVIGTGFMGWVHVEALRRAGVEVAGVLGSSAKKSRQFCEQWQCGQPYESFEQVLNDAAAQSIHIATPNRTHYDMTRQALLAGKHVMCEKPLAMTTEETRALVDLAAKHPQQVAAVNYNIRFYALCQEAAERIRQGQIGDVLHVNGSYVQDWLLYSTDYNWRVLSEEGGPLRAIADIGTHWLDLMRFITGLSVESVCADLQTVHVERHRPLGEVHTFAGHDSGNGVSEAINISTDDAGCVLLRFGEDAKGSLQVSQVTAGRKNCLRYEIAGSNGSLSWNSEVPNVLDIGYRDRPNESLIRDPALLTEAGALATSYPGGHNEGYADSFKHCFQSFYQYIRAADFSIKPPFATFADGHHEALICDAILQSHQQRRWVDVAES
jgi:predicted dehydrogenase